MISVIRLGLIAVCSIAMGSMAMTSQAIAGALLLDCTSCSEQQRRAYAAEWGNGTRYTMDLRGRYVKKYLVTGSPIIPLRTGEDLRAPVQVTEQPVEAHMQTLYRDIQNQYDVNPNFFQNQQYTVPISNLGTEPGSPYSFQPFDIGHFGSGSAHYQNFMQRVRNVVQSQSWTRDAINPELARALFSFVDRINALGIELVGGASIGWENYSGPWIVSFCNSENYCTKVKITMNKEVKMVGSFDPQGNLIPPRHGSGHSSNYPNTSTGTGTASAVVNNLRARGVDVAGSFGGGGSGWIYITCTYINGVLSRCVIQYA